MSAHGQQRPLPPVCGLVLVTEGWGDFESRTRLTTLDALEREVWDDPRLVDSEQRERADALHAISEGEATTWLFPQPDGSRLGYTAVHSAPQVEEAFASATDVLLAFLIGCITTEENAQARLKRALDGLGASQ